MVMIDENELALLRSYRDQHGHRSNEIGALRAEVERLTGIIDEAQYPTNDDLARYRERAERAEAACAAVGWCSDALSPDAGRPILEALEAARALVDERVGKGTSAFARLAAAIEALGIRGGA